MGTTGIDGDELGACEVEGEATTGTPNEATGAVGDEIGAVEDGVHWVGRIRPEGDAGLTATAGTGICAAALPVTSGVAVGASARAKTGMVWLVAVVFSSSPFSGFGGSGIVKPDEAAVVCIWNRWLKGDPHGIFWDNPDT